MPWYKDFFEKYYLDFWFPGSKLKSAQAKKQVNFIKQVLKLPKGAKILDLCCGHGRHLLPLAKAGYQMTGLDLNKKSLSILARNAEREKLKIKIIRSDMRRIPFNNEFDAIINIFTSFGYFKNERENFKVLKAISKSLKTGGKFLIDHINKDWFLVNFKPKDWTKNKRAIILEERFYNPKINFSLNKIQIIDKKCKIYNTSIQLRIYSLAEMKKNLDKAGLKIINIYGNTISKEKFTKNSPRMVILAQKI